MERKVILKTLNWWFIQNFKLVCVYEVKHCKVCVESKHEGKCLKGVKLDCPPCRPDKPCRPELPCKPEKPC